MTLMLRLATSTGEMRIKQNNVDVKIGHVHWGDEN